ncbi:transcription factor IIA subunit alpha [Gaertneriomyces sp. JEL0708]|nr:transcription factor IIA subunit alpha [Gaertneriomyces sp. JEL0708]
MSNDLVPNVYNAVIDEVCERAAPQFAEMGVGQNILAELRQTWKRKMASMRVADFDYKEEPLDEGLDDYDRAYGADYAYSAHALAASNGYAQPPQGQYVIPQTDGACDESSAPADLNRTAIDALIKKKWMERGSLFDESAASSSHELSTPKGKTIRVAQVDGVDDDDDEDDEDDNEEGIGSDLDDDDSDDENADISNIILCQYEKVNRVKNKWKCTLKDGIITVNGKDYVFNKRSSTLDDV